MGSERETEQSIYSINLQRAIEYHCRGKLVPDDVVKECPHHTKMLNQSLPQASDTDLDAALAIVGKRTPGEWEFWTGCSWRRFGIKGTLKTVVCPTNHHRDNHPDLLMEENDGQAIVAAAAAAVNNFEPLAERCKRAEETEAFKHELLAIATRENEKLTHQRDELLRACVEAGAVLNSLWIAECDGSALCETMKSAIDNALKILNPLVVKHASVKGGPIERKTLEQIFCESYFGIEGWKSRTRLERLAFKRAVAAVEREVLRRLNEEGVFCWAPKGIAKVKYKGNRLYKKLMHKPKAKKPKH